MARAPNPKADKAEKLYKQGVPLVEIAKQLNVPAGTVRRWKSTYRWDGEKPNARNQNERSVKKTVHKAMVESVENNDELTERRKLFCLHYAESFNATQSYLKAYGGGYDVAKAEGPALLAIPCVRDEVKRLKKIKWESMLVEPSDVVERYMKIAFADLSDYVEWGRSEVPVMSMYGPVQIKDEETGESKPLMQEINDIKFKESTEVDGGIVSEVKLGKSGASIKLADRMKALDWLTHFFELNPMDRHRKEYDIKKLELETIKAQSGTDRSAEDRLADYLNALEETVKHGD